MDAIGEQAIGGNGSGSAGKVLANGRDKVGQLGVEEWFAAANVDRAKGAGELGYMGGG